MSIIARKRHNLNVFVPPELKEEKDVVKTDEKLQNGESNKEGGAPPPPVVAAAAAAVVNVSEERKKATKQRFMFNIADGGFTGKHTHRHTHLSWFSSVK